MEMTDPIRLMKWRIPSSEVKLASGNCLSKILMSFENLLIICPEGISSKITGFAREMLVTILEVMLSFDEMTK